MRPAAYVPWPVALVLGAAMAVVWPVWFVVRLVAEAIAEARARR